jgi:hypothetical protein
LRPPTAFPPPGGSDFAEPGPKAGEPPLAFWSAAIDARVLRATASRAANGDAESFDLRRLDQAVTVLRGGGEPDHVLIVDGPRRLRLEVKGASPLDGPVRLRYDLLRVQTDPNLWAQRRLLALGRLGRLPRSLFPPDRRLERWARALQAYDGHCAGATHLDIARVVLGERMFRGDANLEAMRKQAARLIGLAERRIDAERRRFLGPQRSAGHGLHD